MTETGTPNGATEENSEQQNTTFFYVVDWSDEAFDGFDTVPGGFDANDVHRQCGLEKVAELVENAPQTEIPPPDKAKSSDDDDQQSFVDFVVGSCLFFHTPSREPFARITVDDKDGAGQHLENHPIQGTELWQLLAYRYHQETGQSAGTELRRQAASVCEGLALFEGAEKQVHTRVARQGTAIYLDLCNDSWEVVSITPEAIEIVKNPPVLFRRSRSMLTLPKPMEGGSLEDLRTVLNLPEGPQGDQAFTLIEGILIGYLAGHGPYVILILEGEQGSSKTTVARIVKYHIDPTTAAVRTLPKTEQDLIISARNSLVLAFDNLPRLDPSNSDALCRLSTGTGWAARQLYTDQSETIIEVARPIILNGITTVATRHDLADRSVIINLPSIPPERRKPESQLWAEIEAARPQILGALCRAVQEALCNEEEVRNSLTRLPRMADFAVFATAGLPEIDDHGNPVPWDQNSFLRAYNLNRMNAIENTLEGNLLADTLKRLVDFHETWEGSPSELLSELEAFVPAGIEAQKDWQKRHYWPGSARALGRQLRVYASFLRAVGVDVSPGRTNSKRTVRVSRVEKTAGPGDATSGEQTRIGFDNASPEANCKGCGYFVCEPKPGGCALKGETRKPGQAACSDFESDQLGPGERDVSVTL